MHKIQYLDSKESASKGRVPRERDQIPNMKSQPPFEIVILPFIQHIFTEHKHCVSTIPGALEAEVKERNKGLCEAYKGKQAHPKQGGSVICQILGLLGFESSLLIFYIPQFTRKLVPYCNYQGFVSFGIGVEG